MKLLEAYDALISGAGGELALGAVQVDLTLVTEVGNQTESGVLVSCRRRLEKVDLPAFLATAQCLALSLVGLVLPSAGIAFTLCFSAAVLIYRQGLLRWQLLSQSVV
jgi:hypothetical protein